VRLAFGYLFNLLGCGLLFSLGDEFYKKLKTHFNRISWQSFGVGIQGFIGFVGFQKERSFVSCDRQPKRNHVFEIVK